MFERLQKRWKVNGLQLALVICTFAIGGSLTGYAGRKLMSFLAIGQGWLWVIVYILLITLLWPLAVLLVSIPFGQFRFFTKYLKGIGRRMGVVKKLGVYSPEVRSLRVDDGRRMADDRLLSSNNDYPSSIHIAIFASGAGSNAQMIIDHFRDSSSIRVSLIVCNNPGAGVLNIAEKERIPVLLLEKERFFHGDAYLDELQQSRIGFIALAGFLWKIPALLIRAYPGKIVNIHPALLPGYGGKGMYGRRVHEAVIAAGETESGISIHYVDEIYDHGQVILQEKCTVLPEDTPATLARKIHALEHQHYPVLIEKLIAGKAIR